MVRILFTYLTRSNGFALAGAVGAYYAKKDNIFVVVGDGSIMMNLQELQTIKHNNIPAKIIVINNVYGIIRRSRKIYLEEERLERSYRWS